MQTEIHTTTIAAVLAQCPQCGIELQLRTNFQTWLITSITLTGNSLRIHAENSNSNLSLPVNLEHMRAFLVPSMQHFHFTGSSTFTIAPIDKHRIHAIMHAYDKTHTQHLNSAGDSPLNL